MLVADSACTHVQWVTKVHMDKYELEAHDGDVET